MCFCFKGCRPGRRQRPHHPGMGTRGHRPFISSEMPGSPEGKLRQLKQSQRQRAAQTSRSPAARPSLGPAHVCVCVSPRTNPCSVGMLGSQGRGLPGQQPTRTIPDRGCKADLLLLAERHLPRGHEGGRWSTSARARAGVPRPQPRGSFTRETGAAAEPPPEIRWAENAKNRDFETLLPRLVPQRGSPKAPLGPRGPTVAPDQAWGAQRDTLLEEGRDGENRGRGK